HIASPPSRHRRGPANGASGALYARSVLCSYHTMRFPPRLDANQLGRETASRTVRLAAARSACCSLLRYSALQHVMIHVTLAVDRADDVDRHLGAVSGSNNRMHAD